MSGAALEHGAAGAEPDLDDLRSPATDAGERERFDAVVQAHRQHRTVQVGPHVVLVFEDALTVRHRLRETLRIARISDAAEVRAEIDACVALIPDGSNFKATLTLEFASAEERVAKLPGLVGVEQHLWMQVDGSPRVLAVAQEDVGRARIGAPVGYNLRVDLGKLRVRDLRKGNRLSVGIDHGLYRASLVLSGEVRQLLLQDLR